MRRKMMLSIWTSCVVVNVWSQASPDFSRNRDEAIRNLQGLVRIDTSNPPGNETKAVELAVNNVCNSQSEYFLTTTFTGRKENQDIVVMR